MAQTAPLSWQQEQIWLHGQWAGAAPIYQETVAIRRQGGFAEAPLRSMLAAWVARHDILRTTFVAGADAPVQRVAAQGETAPLAIADLASETEALALAQADACTPMDLANGSLVRARWTRWPEGQGVYLTLHHLIFDGATVRQIWLPEWALAYGAGSSEAAPPAAAPGYAEYARWQRRNPDAAGAERAAEHRDFWRRHYQGEWPRLELGGDPAAPRFAAVSRRFRLEPALWAALARTASAARATPFMVLLAACAALLHRLGGQETVIVGLPAAARGERRWARLAGPMVNTLALRFDCGGNPSFSAFLRQARDNLLDALAHEEYPYTLALREAPGESTAIGLEAYLSFQPPDEHPVPGWELSHLEVETSVSKFPLHFDLEAAAGGAEGRCHCQCSRVDAALATALPEHWRVLLAGVATDAQQRLGALPLLSAEQRRAVLALSRGPEPALPIGSVAEVFARQAAATPEAVAVVALEPAAAPGAAPHRRVLTYAALQRRAEQLARGLRRAGVAPGDVVALALPRSADTIAIFLALLACGAAYLPLELDDPPQRRQRQWRAAGARWLIGSGESGLCALEIQELIRLGAAPEAAPLPAVSPEAIAYIMCTSGSTGEQLPVRIPHRGILRLVANPGYAHFGADESCLLLAPLGFDASTFEIWAPLLNGGRLVIPPPGLPTASELGDWIRQEGVTTLWLTTALFNTVIETAPQALAPLRQVLTGGEVMSLRHIRLARQLLPGVALFNAYGPTENTTFTTMHPVAGASGPMPLGRPIAHSHAYVVDQYGALAPAGAAGELWVGGLGLAAGYVGGLAAERFVAPEWLGGERLFRSGDRMRWENGELAFLGRRDQQIKLRGLRVELSALEAHLARQPGVRQVAVLASGAGADQMLTAFVAAQGTTAEVLRSRLAAELPAAVIPTRWVIRPELPCLPSGKLDRRQLPALAPAPRREPPAAHALSPREEQLRAIWERALGRDGIGREDDFFSLGGHSLSALRICAEMERRFGRRLPLAALPAYRTIAAQAAWLEQGGAAAPVGENPRAVPLQTGDPARPCIYSVEAGDRFLRVAEQMGPQQPWWSLRLASLAELPHPSPMAAIAAYHLRTLRQLQPEGPYLLTAWCQNGVVAFEMARQLAAAGQHVACLALIDSVSPAYLRRVGGFWWPIFRSRYAWHQWRLRRQGVGALTVNHEAAAWSSPAGAAWRRWIYRWRRPADPPRLGEPAAVVQNALRRYRPVPYPGRIVLFRSQHQILSSRGMGRFRDPTMGWEELAAGGLDIREIMGGHTEIFAPPGGAAMAQVFAHIVAAAGGPRPVGCGQESS